jgi:hypothetical protein
MALFMVQSQFVAKTRESASLGIEVLLYQGAACESKPCGLAIQKSLRSLHPQLLCSQAQQAASIPLNPSLLRAVI